MNALIPLAADGRLEMFGNDPVWVSFAKAGLIFVVLVLLTLFNIWLLRRLMGKMQHRPGPNVHGLGDVIRALRGKSARESGKGTGLMQSLADGVKLAFKEDIIPKGADRVVYLVAPILIVVPAFMVWSVIPFGPEVNFFGHRTPLQLTDMPVAVLFVLGILSIGIYGIVLGGWSGGSTYALLGGLRSSAQMISYEVALGLALVAVFMFAGSMSTSEIVAAQNGNGNWWFAFMLLPSFVIYFIASLGETNNVPFDLPEAEGELVGGFHTEYSSLKFALFFLAEFINKITAAAIMTTLFLGGWYAPWPIGALWEGANTGYWPVLWFFMKVYLFIFVLTWLQATLPRTRYDQLMALGWKVLIPAALGWLVLVATMRTLANSEADRTWIYIVLGIGLAIALVLSFFGGRDDEPVEEAEPGPVDAFAGGYPVPPLPPGGAVRGAAAPLVFAPSTTRVAGETAATDPDQSTSDEEH